MVRALATAVSWPLFFYPEAKVYPTIFPHMFGMIGGHALDKQSFAKGAIILTAGSVLSRILGVVSLVAIPRIIKDEGMGLMQMVRPIHSFAVVLSIAGLPVALSKLVAEEMAVGSVQG